MSKWKLCRQTFGSEEFELSEGDEVTVGRGLDNTITLSSIVISRNHGLLKVKKDEITITDLKSSNGIYIGLKRIPPNIPYSISDAAVIGFGWTIGAPLAKILDSEKYVFKLIRCIAPLKNRIVFQSYIDLEEENDDDDDASETKINNPKVEVKSPVFETKLNLKRKLQTQSDINKPVQLLKNNDIINISDNDDDMISKNLKKKKIEDSNVLLTEHEIKREEEDIQYEAFSVKQEYLCDDDAIEISSDNDSESELFVRLSQSSPCKSYVHLDRSANKIDKQHENSSYSQLDDDDVMFVNNMGHTFDEDDFIDDIITIPPIPPQNEPSVEINICNLPDKPKDKVDGISTNIHTELKEKLSINSTSTEQPSIETVKKTQMIEALVKPVRRKSHHTHKDGKKPSTKENKTKNHSSSSSKSSITNNQKEERRRKLKEIASKTKNADIDNPDKKLASNSSKSVTNVKITTSNRGAFLTDNNIVTEKSTNNKDKDSTRRDNKKPSSSTNSKSSTSSKTDEIGKDIAKEVDKSYTESIRLEKPNHQKRDISQEKSGVSKEKEAQKVKDIAKKADKNNTENIRIDKPDHQKRDLSKEKSRGSKDKEAQKETVNKENLNSSKSLHNVPDSLANSLESQSSKPLSKVLPTPRKPKKQVRFSCTNEVFEFETEPGTRMRKTSSVKTRLLDTKKMPSFSLEKITLMKILRWNPQWLDEQKSNVEPPPILGHNNLPMAIFHRFDSHSQYVGLVGDLLLMEIWECLTQAFGRNYKQNMTFQLRVESLPTEAPQEKYFDICNLSANLSLLKSEEKNLPRVGEIMIIEFGPEDNRSRRFFFVHNVRCLPSPPNNKNSFFSLSLYVTFTDRVRLLRPGEVMIGRTLAYINKELTLFDAMEYLSGSPLRNAILRPSQHDFISPCNIYADDMKTQWTIHLNPSQKEAVARSVSAALGDRPSIQMIQGPPGTGKSNVICSIVMTYFYNAASKRHSNRGKILICATSNAAVDELVIRLLDKRQSLPKEERFRMVRVGRLEAMHSRARDVSSQQLAQRGAARDTHSHPGVDEEIAHLEAKINMWKSAEQEAKDPVRVAYCRGRIAEFSSRKAMFRSRKEDVPHERPVHSERRIIERANIIVTTLASAHNHKMRGLKGRIALCIIDEAGQAIEPEALIPLTLDVTRLTLVGDTQQLPGFICSQRAKQHGLGESLFARLSSCAEQWGGGVLLDQQYRMQAAIADYPNRAFYGARVRSVPPAPPPPALALPHYTLLAVASGDRGQGPTYANETEAWGVARVTAALAARLRGALSLAVITPYSAHRDMLRECLRRLQPSESSVEVNTVDSFQGQERDVVVVSLARSQGVGFLTDAGRMNVMLTRARHALFVCLNPLALVKNMQWQTLVDDAHKRNVYVTLPNKLCQPATSHTPVIPHEEVLGHIIK